MPEMNREIDPVIRDKILEVLRERFKPAEVDIDTAVFLSEPTRRNVLMRIGLTSTSELVPKSIIFKQVLPQKGDAEDKGADERFSRDWAGLKFSSSIQKDPTIHNTPKFYGSDKEHRFILIEDLGDPHISLVQSLAPAIPDHAKAVSALERYMKVLGSFNAASYNHTSEYETMLKEIYENAKTPQEDLKSVTDYLHPQLNNSIKLLNLSANEEFTEEVNLILKSIFEPGLFTVFAHGDIAADNVFDHEDSQGLQLIDFEWSSPRNALLDGTYLRMSMPTGWFAGSFPDEILKPLELIYRKELATIIPDASDDLAYSTAYTQACGYQVLHQMATLGGYLEKDSLWESGPLPKDSLWKPEDNWYRSRFLTRLQTFVDVANEHNKLHPDQPPILPNLKTMAEEMLAKVKVLWPEAKPLAMFPAFNAPQLTQTDVTQTVQRYKDRTTEIRQAEPGYRPPTEPSPAEEGNRYSPFQMTPKPSKPYEPN